MKLRCSLKFNKCVSFLAVVLSCVHIAPACGPSFPNSFMDGGDVAMFTAPLADFSNELQRIQLAAPAFSARPATNGYFEQTLNAELADLRKALGKEIFWHDRNLILARYKKEREKLNLKIDAQRGFAADEKATPKTIVVVDGLPAEFANYFRGLIAYHDSDLQTARENWTALLERPREERLFRSTWAAYMLGRSWGDTAEAVPFFIQTRELAKNGFEDSLGLGAASFGWEARVYFKNGDPARAIELYLQQLASGDSSAFNSLRMVSEKVMSEPDPALLQLLAANPKTQRVLTAYVISRGQSQPGRSDGELGSDAADVWLDAVERAAIKDVAAAERLALAAYQNGDMEKTERWLKRSSGSSPTAQWLRAKLLLRAGKLNEASVLLAKIAKFFPAFNDATSAPSKLEQDLWVNEGVSGGREIRGELAVLHLQRREYTQALDALVKADFWTDAAYVAEVVLTADELKNYVDQNRPEKNRNANDAESTLSETENAPDPLRYLLARRLTRLHRGTEARPYFPEELRENLDAFTSGLEKGWNENLPENERAAELWKAAKILRAHGMELAGTELAPDYFIWGGGYEAGPGLETRTNEQFNAIFKASPDEIRRGNEHEAEPDLRFHYRYVAADLAWQAAKLMPDNQEETAIVLCTAGSWIKYRNPPAADRYYKTLVRRCRRTEIGEAADRMRWFPLLDENGKLRKAEAAE